jgi:hypothetical protein
MQLLENSKFFFADTNKSDSICGYCCGDFVSIASALFQVVPKLGNIQMGLSSLETCFISWKRW